MLVKAKVATLRYDISRFLGGTVWKIYFGRAALVVPQKLSGAAVSHVYGSVLGKATVKYNSAYF